MGAISLINTNIAVVLPEKTAVKRVNPCENEVKIGLFGKSSCFYRPH
jgi:hypothetical protein